MNPCFSSSPRFPLQTVLLSCVAAVVLSFLTLCSVENLDGGGSDIGNPPISGTVMASDMKPVRNALVVIGSIDNDSVCDSVYTGNDGSFQSKGLPAGLYAVCGTIDSLSGIARVLHNSVYYAPLTITLDQPALIKLTFDSLAADSTLKIDWAKIAGTGLTFSRGAGNSFALDRAPAGEMDIRVATTGGTVYTMQKYLARASCNAYIIVDPALAPEQWISGGCDVRDPLGSPSIVWVSPPPKSQGSIARVNKNARDDIAIQFSHPMNTRTTTLAVTGWSTDSTIKVVNKSWVGSDVLYISFSNSATVNAQPMFRYPLGTTYHITIDTTAESGFGVHSAKPYTFSFTPEPCPRLLTVEGFRVKVASHYEVVDSLPPVVSLGDSISPSISMLDGNNLVLSFNGTPLAPETGIHCFEADSVSVAGMQFVQNKNYVTIHFPELMKSGSGYRIVIDTTLLLKEGYRFPATQTIRWKTLRFTVDNALVLGSYQTADVSRTISLISGDTQLRYSTSDGLQASTPNLPVTAWYASAPVDTASLRENVILPSPFNTVPVIAEGTKFGFYTNLWLQPASTFRFSVLPGLRSITGDSLGEALTYTVVTDSFSMKEFHVFNLIPLQDQSSWAPRQDTLYNLATCSIYGSSIENLLCSPVYYSTWVNFNAPLSAQSADKLTVFPADGFTINKVRTGYGLFSGSMLIPDTSYTVTLQKGVVDTFGNSSRESFEYRFKTEKFGLKIGNLFGAIFGYQQEIARLPAQLLPNVTIINQNVQPGQPMVITIISNSLKTMSMIVPANLKDSTWIMIDKGTPVGLPVAVLQPGFSSQQNYLFFSGVLDSSNFRDHVHITPDDGSISLKTERNMLQFSTSLSCRAKTTYSIAIDKNFPDCYGHTLGDSLSVGFSTPGFSMEKFVINSTSFGRDSIVAGVDMPRQSTRNFQFATTFNYPIGIASLEKNQSIEPMVSGRLSATLVTSIFTASQLLITDTLYRISCSTSITDRFGANLDTTYTVNFRTEPFSINPVRVGTLENGAVFSITSNALLDTASLLSSIHVQPSRYSSGHCVLSTDSTGFSFVADSTLRFGEQISVVVDTTLQDRFNHRKVRPDTLTFVVTVKKQ